MKKFLVAILTCTSFFAEAQGIVFTDTSWSALLQMAREQNKLIFIDAYTTWCGPCKAMARQVFPDSAVGVFYNEAFISAKFDMEKGDGLLLAGRYQVGCYPTYLFIDSSGSLLHRSAGMMGRKEFVEVGRIALDPGSRYASLENRFRSGEKDPQFVSSFFESTASNCLPVNDAAVNFLSGVPAADLVKTENWTILQKFVTDIRSAPFVYLVNNRDSFSMAHGGGVDEKIYSTYLDRLYSVIYGREKPAAKTVSAFRAEVGSLPFPRASELQLMLDLALAEQQNRWGDYYKVAKKVVEEHRSADHNFLNNVSYNIFEHSYDKEELAGALLWAKKSVDIRAESFNLDTYACLLWKNGRKAEAVTIQQKAIAVARANEEDTGDLEETLRKISENAW